jgi:hypothetical protein
MPEFLLIPAALSTRSAMRSLTYYMAGSYVLPIKGADGR